MVATQLTEQNTSRFAQTSKWRIHYNEAGTGHPLIMMHGSGPGATGWSNFANNIGPLAEKYRVILVDLPGWGQSDSVDPTVEPRDPALACKLLMDELGIEKAALVGNSMGGNAVLDFAVRFNDRMSHAITMGAGYGGVQIFTPGGGPSQGMGVLFETYRDPSPENFRRLVKVMVYDASFVTDQLVEARSRAALANPTHLENQLKPPTAGPGMVDPVPPLRNVETPALIIHGRDDRVLSIETSLRVVSAMPNAMAVIFNKCGHWAQIEHASKFNWLVDDFLSHS
jgi:2-hydroxy-6-oxonona-2,4-dienedioate hydrolase